MRTIALNNLERFLAKCVSCIVLPIGFIVLIALVSQTQGLVINTSPSMAMGLYSSVQHTDIVRGSIVSVCLTPSLAHQAIEQGYISTNSNCPYHAERLIKKVIAIPDDTVLLTARGITVNPGAATEQRYSAPIHVYSQIGHRVITTIKPGLFKIKGYWLYGAGDSNLSWDSRYFGAVKRQQIKAVLKPIWTTNKRAR